MFASVTQFCNLTCRYCSADAGPKKTLQLDPDRLIEVLDQWIPHTTQPEVTLIFTGGEPTAWGYENLRRTAGHARMLAAAAGKPLHLGIQTNGTTIHQGFVEWCRTYHVHPSISLDGIPSTSDLNRGSGHKVLKNLRYLKQEGISFGVICCITKDVADRIDEVLEFFREEALLKVRFNSIGIPPAPRSSDQLTPKDVLKVWTAIYDHMETYGETGVQDRNMTERVAHIDALLAGNSPAKEHCEFFFCGAGRYLVNVNPDGSVGMCVEKSMTDGLPSTFDFQFLPQVARLFWSKQLAWDHCSTCPAEIICDKGCAAYHRNQYSRFESECQSTKKLFATLLQRRVASARQQKLPEVRHASNSTMETPTTL